MSSKKDALFNQENSREDKLDHIKRILGLKESADVKLYMIGEVVGHKEGKGLSEVEIDHNKAMEE